MKTKELKNLQPKNKNRLWALWGKGVKFPVYTTKNLIFQHQKNSGGAEILKKNTAARHGWGRVAETSHVHI